MLAALLSPGWALVAKPPQESVPPSSTRLQIVPHSGKPSEPIGPLLQSAQRGALKRPLGDEPEFRLIGLDTGPVPARFAEDLRVIEPLESDHLETQGWQLVRPNGTLVAQWSAFPGWPDLERRLREEGWRPLSEKLQGFTALHPEASSARLAFLLASMREGGVRDWISPNLIVQFPAAPPAPKPPDRMEEIEAQILALLQDETLPDNPLSTSSLLSVIRWLDPWLSPSVRSGGQASVARWLLRWPSSVPVWETTAALCPGDRFSGFAHAIQTAEAVPGEPWPAGQLAGVSVRWSETRWPCWAEVDALARWALGNLATYPVSGPRAKEAERSANAWRAAQIRALWALGRRSEALLLGENLKSGWPPALYFSLKKLAVEADPDGHRPFEPIWLKAQAGYPEEPGETRIHLGLRVVAEPSHQARLKALEDTAVPLAGNFLRCEFQPGTPPRWSLRDGELEIGEGLGWPEPEEILELTERRSPGTPFGLGSFLRRHPECMEARQRRAGLLAPYVSRPTLGRLVLEDTLHLVAGPSRLAGQIPTPWLEQKARPALSELEAALFRWPDRAPLWEAWIEWMVLARRKPRPIPLAEALPWPPRRREALEAGPVPFAVAHKVLELLIEKQFNTEANAWAEWTWQGGLSGSVEKMLKPDWEPNEGLHFPGMGVDRKSILGRLESRFLVPWRKSLAVLGRKPLPDLQALENRTTLSR